MEGVENLGQHEEIIEGEAVDWLMAAGLETAVEQYEKGEFIEGPSVKQQLSFLTNQQRVTIQKRVDTLNKRTLKKRKRHVKNDPDVLPGVVSETDGSRYFFDRVHPDETFPAQKFSTRSSYSGVFPDDRISNDLGRRSDNTNCSSNQITSPSPAILSRKLEPNSKVLSNHRLPSSRESTGDCLNGRPDSIESAFVNLDEDDFELIDGVDDFVEEEEEFDSLFAIPPSVPTHHIPIAPLSRHESVHLGSVSYNFASLRPKTEGFIPTENQDETDGDKGARTSRLWSTGSLPRVYLSSKERKNGISTLYDMSSADVSKLNALSVIQLTSIFDRHDIPFSIPKKTPKIASKHPPAIFGRALSTLVDEEAKVNQNQGQYIMCPRFLLELLRHLMENSLRENRILRKSGNAARVRDYRKDLDLTFNSRQFDWKQVNCHDAASLLKQFLQELPVPLLTFEFMYLFPLVCKMNCKVGKKLEALNLLILMLPCSHSHTLKLLLVYLSKVVQNEQFNHMNLESVATIMTPNLFTDNKSKSQSVTLSDDVIKSNQEQQEVLQLLINYHEQLWLVPDVLLSELRFKHSGTSHSGGSTDKQKTLPVLKSIFKRHHHTHRRESLDHVDGVGVGFGATSALLAPIGIVTAPAPNVFTPRKLQVKLGQDCHEVEVDELATVGDIMQRVIERTMPPSVKCSSANPSADSSSVVNERGDHSSDATNPRHGYSQDGWIKAIQGDISKKLCLFEVGGNINRRCLSDEKALMRNLCELNPAASWVVDFR